MLQPGLLRSVGSQGPGLRRALLERRAGARWRAHTGRARLPWSSRERRREQKLHEGLSIASSYCPAPRVRRGREGVHARRCVRA
eukprot:6209228-Pleurochrysis_carterae.AAC.2